MKKCVYCKREVTQDSVIDFCEGCGRAAFGDRLFETILENMKMAHERGDLEQSR